jgi:hypothetical protein
MSRYFKRVMHPKHKMAMIVCRLITQRDAQVNSKGQIYWTFDNGKTVKIDPLWVTEST